MQKVLIILGLVILIVGLTWPWLSSIPLGRLPGDIVMQRDNFTFYFPITSMILISGAVSLIFWICR